MTNSEQFYDIELFHVHIPKTAGTSLNASLEATFGDAFANHDAKRMREDCSIRAAAAHTTLLSAKNLFPNAKLITVIREPISRFKSTLRHLYARRNWQNYADIGPTINSLIDADGYVNPNEEILSDQGFVNRFDNLIVRYLTEEPVVDRVTISHLQSAIHAMPNFFQILHQDKFSSDVEKLFSRLGISAIEPATTNTAKSQIPLWDSMPDALRPYVEFDLALYDAILT